MTRRTLRCTLATLLLLACGRSAPTVVPSGETARIVSLSPSITETLFALDRSDRLVGRSDWCKLPSAAEALPTAGTALTPRLEAIAGMRPTLVVLESTLAGDTRNLDALAPTEILPWLTLDEVRSSIVRLGVITDAEPAAAALSTRFAALATAPPPDAPRAIALLGLDELDKGRLWYIKPSSLHGAALAAAGLAPAVPDPASGPPTISVEALVAAAPEVIVVLLAEEVTEAVIARVRADLSRLPMLPAVQQGRIAVIGGPTILATGPSVLDLPQRIRAALPAGATP